MLLASGRARRAAAALAAGFALAQPAFAPARAEDVRVVTVQDDAELKKRADLLLKGISEGGGKVTWGALERGSTPEGLVIKQIEITSADDKKITIDQIEVRSLDWANPKEPRYVDLSVRKLVVGADALDKEGADNLKELDLTALTIHGDLAYKFDEAEKSFDIGKVFIDFAELGELRLRLKLTGVTPADLKAATGEKAEPAKPGAPGDDQAMNLLSRLNLSGAAISFKDKGLMQRAIRADAKKKNIDEASARNKMIEEIAEERAKAEDEVTKEFLDAAIKFVRNPGEIELTAAPAAPANVMMAFMMVMGNRASFKQLLGLSIAVK
jgi:hypothetical protein